MPKNMGIFERREMQKKYNAATMLNYNCGHSVKVRYSVKEITPVRIREMENAAERKMCYICEKGAK
jgi:hypothetical protein